MAEMMTVLVTMIRPLRTDDGLLLHELTVLDQTTGDEGLMLVSAAQGQDLLGDCPTSDLVAVDRELIAWSRDG